MAQKRTGYELRAFGSPACGLDFGHRQMFPTYDEQTGARLAEHRF
jgi:hypothetical protein